MVPPPPPPPPPGQATRTVVKDHPLSLPKEPRLGARAVTEDDESVELTCLPSSENNNKTFDPKSIAVSVTKSESKKESEAPPSASDAATAVAAVGQVNDETTPRSSSWTKATSLLQQNPSLVSHHILCLALRHKPPVSVVDLLLKLNKSAADIPSVGPTALQVTVQHGCPVPIVERVLKACPFALVATNPGSYLDPLSYAKRFRSKETQLLRLLSLPLQHWIEQDNNKAPSKEEPPTTEYKEQPKPKPLPVTNPSSFLNPYPAAPRLRAEDRQEMDNVKHLCVGVVKGHKRLSREWRVLKQELTTLQKESRRQWEQTKERQTSLLQDVQDEQQRQFKVQLIALDMKEKAMRAHVKRMEQRLMLKVQDKISQAVAAALSSMQLQQKLAAEKNRRSGSAATMTVKMLQTQIFGFQRRLETLEAKKSSRRLSSSKGLSGRKTKKKKQTQYQLPYGSFPRTSAVAGSPTTITTRSSRSKATTTATPIVFCTPDKMVNDDDSLSLLTEDMYVERKTSSWWWKSIGFGGGTTKRSQRHPMMVILQE